MALVVCNHQGNVANVLGICVGVFVWEFLCGSICVGVSVWESLCGSLCVGVSVWECLCGSVCVESHVLQDNGKFVANIFHRWRLSGVCVCALQLQAKSASKKVWNMFVLEMCLTNTIRDHESMQVQCFVLDLAFVVCNSQAKS